MQYLHVILFHGADGSYGQPLMVVALWESLNFCSQLWLDISTRRFRCFCISLDSEVASVVTVYCSGKMQGL